MSVIVSESQGGLSTGTSGTGDKVYLHATSRGRNSHVDGRLSHRLSSVSASLPSSPSRLGPTSPKPQNVQRTDGVLLPGSRQPGPGPSGDSLGEGNLSLPVMNNKILAEMLSILTEFRSELETEVGGTGELNIGAPPEHVT